MRAAVRELDREAATDLFYRALNCGDGIDKLQRALVQARAEGFAQGQQEERSKGCETCQHRQRSIVEDHDARWCLRHGMPIDDLGLRCGRWAPVGGEGRKET